MGFIGILSRRQEKNREFFCYVFTSSRIFSRPTSRYSFTKNSAKINFTVHDAMLRKLDGKEKLPFETLAFRPLGAANRIWVKS